MNEEQITKPALVLANASSTGPLFKALNNTFDFIVFGPMPGTRINAHALTELKVDDRALIWAGGEGARCSTIVWRALESGVIQSRLAQSTRSVPASWIRPFVTMLPGMVNLKVQEYAVLLYCLEAWHSRVPIAGVVLHNDVEGPTKLLALWGKRKGLATIHVPHALYSYAFRSPVVHGDVHDDVTCETVLAISPFQVRWYQERGAQDVELVGPSMWESWLAWNLTQDEAAAAWGLSGTFVVTYVATWGQITSLLGLKYVNFAEQAYMAFLEAAQAHGWDVIVKIHPSAPPDSEAWHKVRAEQFRVRCRITRSYKELSVLAANVLVACGPSGLLFEAALVDRPGLVIGPGYEGQPMCEPSADAIGRAVEELPGKWHMYRDHILSEYVGPVQGATERTVNAILARCANR